MSMRFKKILFCYLLKTKNSTTRMENPTQPSLRYAWYVVIVLMLANVSSFIDRQILALLVVPIKRDLHLSDT